MKKIISLFLILIFLIFNNCTVFAAQNTVSEQKHPCYNKIFLDIDKYENFNRKIFNFNLRMNKIFVKKIHIIWASVMPNFIINGLTNMYNNIEYPKRLVSSILQRDFDAIKNETKRFFINTTIGLGGFFDFAYKVFNLEMYNEDMEQALAKCKICCGSYLILPFISSTTSRDIIGRIFDFLLNPTTYIASPVAAAVKMGLLINRTAYIQPVIKMVESNFCDPYDIARKFFGVEKYIKLSNYDRSKILENIKLDYDEVDLVDSQKKEENLNVKGKIQENENLIVNEYGQDEISADIFLLNYNPQNPVLDSMRTALFDLKETEKSIWADISIWNRSFNKKIKTAEIQISKDRPKYKFRYILQKEKQTPLAIIFPSIGEGAGNNHSTILAKIFYNEGYSVIIFGSHFQWEFLKSIERGYKIGLLKDDVKFINLAINNAISYLSKKYDRAFLTRTALGTSLGAYSILYLANNQYEDGAKNIDKFIAICPPIELMYAIKQIDKIIDSWRRYPDDLKEKVAVTTAKVMKAYEKKEELSKNFDSLPFTNYEAKLISAFIFHQKLSDLIYTTELIDEGKINNTEFYENIYNFNFDDYIKKYLLVNYSYEELEEISSLRSISNYLISNDNYKIFHALDDYLTNETQIKELKSYCGDKLVLFNNGAHLGFLYRDEFKDALKKEIKINR